MTAALLVLGGMALVLLGIVVGVSAAIVVAVLTLLDVIGCGDPMEFDLDEEFDNARI